MFHQLKWYITLFKKNIFEVKREKSWCFNYISYVGKKNSIITLLSKQKVTSCGNER